MILSNLETGGGMALVAEGQTKTTIMLTDTSTVPYSAYYDMPNGYVSWLSIVASGNLFTITAQNNLFSETSRSAVVRFWCLPTSTGTLQSLNVTVTQASDAIEVTFTPESVSLAYTEGATDDAELTGVPEGAAVTITSPAWLAAEMVDADTLRVTAEINPLESARSGSVSVTVAGRTFYLPVTQAANTLAVTFDPTSASFGYASSLSVALTATGIPSGAEVTFTSPDWVSASIGGTTVTLVATENTSGDARSGTVYVTVHGRTFNIPVTQAATPYPDGKLTLSASSHTFTAFGGSLTVTATEMPPGASLLTYSSPPQGTCVACGDTGAFVSITRLTDTSFSIAVEPQDIFNAVQRVFLVDFEAGGMTSRFTITQAVPSVTLYRLGGMGDKFLRSVSSLQEPSYLVESTALFLSEQLKRAGWMALDTQRSPLLVGADRDEVPSITNSLEAYKACHTHVQTGGTTYHKLAMGAMAYRFTFTPESYGIVLRGLRFSVRTDAYCAAGLRVALAVVTDGDDEPTADWDTIREGTGGKMFAGFAARELRADGKYYGKTSQAIFDGLNLTIDADTRIYLYVTMEDYPGTMNGWVYGSGIVAPLFDFYTEDLTATAGELEVDDWIAEAGTTERSGLMSLVAEGEISDPGIEPRETCKTRELVAREFVLGTGAAVPSDAVAMAAIPVLFAITAKDGFVPVDMTKTPMLPWPAGQTGLCASLSRHAGGESSPFRNVVRYTVSPVALFMALPIGATATALRLTQREGQPTLSASGADIRVTVYWFAAQRIEIADIPALAVLPAFSAGGTPLVAGTRNGVRIGSIELPTSLAAGASVSVSLGAFSDRWGTLLIVPWIARVTTTAVPIGAHIGLVGPKIDDDAVTGGGWVPDITLEV